MNPTAPADTGPSTAPTTYADAAVHQGAGSPARVSAPSGLVITGAVVGGVALLVSAIPLVNILSVLGGVAAVVIGVVVLRRLAPGAAGRGLAVTAVVLGALATAIATAVLLALGMLIATGDGVTVDELGPDAFVEELSEPIDPDAVVGLP